MFDFDSFREIFSTIKKNKLRTFLTGLAVAWGIFMLIILLGFANGFRNATMSNFSGRAKNTISLYPGYTSKPFKGTPSNKEIKFDNRDYDLICNKMPNVEYVSAEISKFDTIAYGKQYGSWTTDGVSPDYAQIRNVKIKNGKGRFINDIDMAKKRKVMVINSDMEKVLFKEEDPIGKFVIVSNKLVFQVIGVYDKKNQFSNSQPTYIPYSTAQLIFNQGGNFDHISFTVNGVTTEEASEAFEKSFRKKIANIHQFDPDDNSAIYVRNTAKDSAQTENILKIINLFILIIGAASLVAGIVGVGNIMLITVKERTKEIGIRKAIGASSASILRLIITEAIFITTAAGYAGIVLGTAITAAIGAMLDANAGDGPTMLKDPTVSLTTVIFATLALIICGVGAGLIPALKATQISPIEAMRAE